MENQMAKKKGYQQGIQKKCGRNLRLEVSWPTKDNGILPRRGCWKIEEFCPKKIAINCVKKKLLSIWLREDMEGKKCGN